MLEPKNKLHAESYFEGSALKESESDDLLEGENSASLDIGTIYPNAEVRVAKVQYSTTHLKRLVENREELIIDPDFQRRKVWKNKQSAELVESILMGIPIPVIYLFEMKNGTKQVVDGRQRITAILDFLNDKLTLKDLKILPQCNNKKFSDLDSKMQGIFEDYQLSFYIIQPPTPERVKYDIFDRVNRGGTQLNSQEMRNALYIGRATRLLKELAASEIFIKATEGSIKPQRMKDQYVILRAIAFYLMHKSPDTVTRFNGNPIEYKSDIDDFLAKYMVFINDNAPDDLIEYCKRFFLKAMQNCYTIMGKNAFRFKSESGNRRPINMPLFEIMVYIFADDCVTIDELHTQESVEEFKTKFDHQQMFMGNVDSTVNLNERYRLASNLLNTIANDK